MYRIRVTLMSRTVIHQPVYSFLLFTLDEFRMARRVLMVEVSGGRARGRSRLGWTDGVKVALGNRGMTVESARQCAKDRKEWRALVHML